MWLWVQCWPLVLIHTHFAPSVYTFVPIPLVPTFWFWCPLHCTPGLVLPHAAHALPDPRVARACTAHRRTATLTTPSYSACVTAHTHHVAHHTHHLCSLFQTLQAHYPEEEKTSPLGTTYTTHARLPTYRTPAAVAHAQKLRRFFPVGSVALPLRAQPVHELPGCALSLATTFVLYTCHIHCDVVVYIQDACVLFPSHHCTPLLVMPLTRKHACAATYAAFTRGLSHRWCTHTACGVAPYLTTFPTPLPHVAFSHVTWFWVHTHTPHSLRFTWLPVPLMLSPLLRSMPTSRCLPACCGSHLP